jgi:hypothetical protein
MRAKSFCLLLLGMLVLGACQREVAVGHEQASVDDRTPARIWQADHEPGTLDEWLADGSGWKYTQGNGAVEVTEEHARSGKYALKASIATDDGAMHQAVIARELVLEEGRYGAWYYFSEAVEADYWVIMKLSNGRDRDRFDIDVTAPNGAAPRLRLYEHGQDYITEPAGIPIPLGEWVHIEALYRSTPDDDGRLIVLQNGERVLDTGPRRTASDASVSFVVGSVSWWIAGGRANLYIDDASIADASAEAAVFAD